MKQNRFQTALTGLVVFMMAMMVSQSAQAMHVMEGFLPPTACIAWGILCVPFIIAGVVKINRILEKNPSMITILAMAGAFTFVLSALKIPSVTGSSSHMTGLGFAAILFGPSVAGILALIVLLFQALLLAHGGLTTLGANVFSMGIVGPVVAFCIFAALNKFKTPRSVGVFLAASLGDLATYVTTSFQLALAYPGEASGVSASFMKFAGIFAITQVPLAIVEGILTVVLINIVLDYGKDIIPAFGKEDPAHE